MGWQYLKILFAVDSKH